MPVNVRPMIKALGDYIDRYIKEKGISARELARVSGVKTHATVSNLIKANVRDTSLSTIVGIAKVMGIKPHQLIAIAESSAPASIPIPKGFVDSDFHRLYEDYALLPPEEKRNADVLIGAIREDIKRRREENEQEATVRKQGGGGSQGSRLSAVKPSRKQERTGPPAQESYTESFPIKNDEWMLVPIIGPANANEKPVDNKPIEKRLKEKQGTK
jgi:transcriptional regulator with XRE-family HTH domain